MERNMGECLTRQKSVKFIKLGYYKIILIFVGASVDRLTSNFVNCFGEITPKLIPNQTNLMLRCAIFSFPSPAV